MLQISSFWPTCRMECGLPLRECGVSYGPRIRNPLLSYPSTFQNVDGDVFATGSFPRWQILKWISFFFEQTCQVSFWTGNPRKECVSIFVSIPLHESCHWTRFWQSQFSHWLCRLVLSAPLTWTVLRLYVKCRSATERWSFPIPWFSPSFTKSRTKCFVNHRGLTELHASIGISRIYLTFGCIGFWLHQSVTSVEIYLWKRIFWAVLHFWPVAGHDRPKSSILVVIGKQFGFQESLFEFLKGWIC